MAGGRQAIDVRCYAGYRGEEAPRSFVVGEEEMRVKEIVQAWRTPQARYFRVRAGDGDLYVLRHQERDDLWQLIARERPTSLTGQDRSAGS